MALTDKQVAYVIAYFNVTQEMLFRLTQADLKVIMQDLKQQKMHWISNPEESNRIELQYGLFEKLLSFKERTGDL
jgi:hypothetical protein